MKVVEKEITEEQVVSDSGQSSSVKEQHAGLQHMEALRHANRVRLARAELKRKVGRGEIAVRELVLDTPEAATNMTVAELLLSQRRWGWIRCRKVLSAVPISETKTLGSLTERQRSAVIDQLDSLQLKSAGHYTPAAAA